MKNHSYFIIQTFFLFLLVFGLQTEARADVVDSTFNAQLQTATFHAKTVSKMVTLPDGKTLAAGSFNTYNGTPVGGLIRLNADATLDTTFNNDLITPGPGIVMLLLQQDGKILLRGDFTLSNGTQYAWTTVVRLNADGTLDSSFSYPLTGGILGVTIDSSDRVLVSGFLQYVDNGTTVNKNLVRLNTDGTIDSSFNHPQSSNGPRRITTQSNKVLYTATDSAAQQDRLFRLNEDGSNDNSFTSTLLGNVIVLELKTQPDNKILTLATNRKISRVNENGGLDSGFQELTFTSEPIQMRLNSDGKITIAHNVNTAPFGTRIFRVLSSGAADPSFTPYNYTGTEFGDYTVQLDGGVLLGDSSATSVNRFTRLKPNGTVDTAFNPGGTGFINVSPGKIRAISVLPDEKILIGGDFDRVNNIDRKRIARLNPDSTLDTSFQITIGTTGNRFTSIDDIYNISVQTDGKILVSGKFIYVRNSVQKENLVRLNTDGSIDSTFNLSVNLVDSFVVSGFSKNKPLQMADGRILVGTTKWFTGDPTMVPLVLNNSGAQDASFNSGIYTTESNAIAYDVAFQPDGKILVAGKHRVGDTFSGFIARLNPDGSVDQSFQISELINKEVIAFSLLQNGQILTVTRTNLQSQVSRLNSDGSIDNSFNTGIGANGLINAIAVLPNSKILVGGAFSTYNNQPRQNLALLNADGTVGESLGNINREVLCITVDNQGRALIGGLFTSININGQQVNRSYLARFNASVRRSYFDFDGDGKTDISIFRPSVGEWWYLHSSDGGNYAAQFGNSSDKLAPGDFTGDGKTDIAVWRPVSGEWFILRSEDGSYYSFPFGTNGDIPAVGDFDGDGKADQAVFRPSDTTWYIRRSSDGGFTIRQFGASGDVPVVSDYDGDGKSDIAIYRASTGEWWIQKSSNSSVVAFQFGNSSDKPVQGDYTGDGKADVAIFRPNTGEWFILRSENQSYYSFPFGTSGDVPAPGDFDGDGKFDATVFRPSDSNWYVQRSTAGTLIQAFGTKGDAPVPAAFIP